MAYVTVSHWNATEWTDEMESEAGKFVPLIMACGASTVQLVRTGDLSMCVITQYDDEEKANAVQEAGIAILLQSRAVLDGCGNAQRQKMR